jgi:integrase
MQKPNTAYTRRARVSVFVERKPFTPFTAKSIKSRMRLIDTSSDRWQIGEACPISIDFSSFATSDSQFAQMMVHQLKAFVARELPHKSPSTVLGVLGTIRAFYKSFEFEDLDEESFDDLLSDNLLYYIHANRRENDEANLNALRYWYRRSYLMGLQGFNQETAQALSMFRFRGHIEGADVLSAIPNRGPLTALELKALKEALREFDPPANAIPGLIFIWLVITLGIRTSQAALLMRSDFVVHIDEHSGHRTYLVNMPSVKKRYALPRTYFKQRPLPTFLGEMIERYLKSTQSEAGPRLDNAPMFSLQEGRRRHSGIVCEQYEQALGRAGVSDLSKALLEAVNNQRVAYKKAPLTFKVTPRRLRKTFATNAAAMGVPMVELAELLDHEDLQHVMVYYKLGFEFATKLDQVMVEQYQDILTYFQGEISLNALVDKSLPSAVFGPDRLRKLVGIGMCAKGAPCNLTPPNACYVCPKFEACNDPNIHREVLESMESDIKFQFGDDVPPGLLNAPHISACQQLIAQLEKNHD